MSAWNYLNPNYIYFILKWKYPEQSQLLSYYLLVWFTMWIVAGYGGVVLSYMALTALSLGYMWYRHIKIPRGSGWIGALTGSISIILVFFVLLLSGSISIDHIAPDNMAIILAGALLQVLVCAGEELSFRNCIFEDLSRMVKPRWAAALSSAAFALMHAPVLLLINMSPAVVAVTLISLFTGGVLLSVLYTYGGLINAWAFHFFWNTLEYSVLGLGPLASAIVLRMSDNVIISGYGYGPESSIVGLAALVATLLAILYIYGKQQRILPGRGPVLPVPLPKSTQSATGKRAGKRK